MQCLEESVYKITDLPPEERERCLWAVEFQKIAPDHVADDDVRVLNAA